jgi:hypothetical protein
MVSNEMLKAMFPSLLEVVVHSRKAGKPQHLSIFKTLYRNNHAVSS